jgi:hypothetical protein
MKALILPAVLAGCLALSTPILADEVETSIDEALSAYQAGDYAGAKQALDYASQLVLQMSAGSLANVLPAPLPGWEAEESESQAVGMSMFGGGIQASRIYRKDGDTVELQVVGDSPMLAQWIPMISNPAMGAAMGAKLVRVGDQRGLQTEDGEIMLVVDNRFLITISGTAPDGDKTAYAQAIDFAALQAL